MPNFDEARALDHRWPDIHGHHRPDFAVQTDRAMTAEERRVWFHERTEEFKRHGMTWAQHSVDDADDPKITLFEGWIVRPKKQPPPKFRLLSEMQRASERGEQLPSLGRVVTRIQH